MHNDDKYETEGGDLVESYGQEDFDRLRRREDVLSE